MGVNVQSHFHTTALAVEMWSTFNQSYKIAFDTHLQTPQKDKAANSLGAGIGQRAGLSSTQQVYHKRLDRLETKRIETLQYFASSFSLM